MEAGRSKRTFFIPPVSEDAGGVESAPVAPKVYVRPVEEIPFVPEEPKTSWFGRSEAEVRYEIGMLQFRVQMGEAYKAMSPSGIAAREADARKLECCQRELEELLNRPHDWPRNGGEALAMQSELDGEPIPYNWLLTRDFEQTEYVRPVEYRSEEKRVASQGEFLNDVEELDS